MVMDCATAREAISATLDDEEPGVEVAALDSHLQECPGCTAWRDEAAAVTRLARLGSASEAPDVRADVFAGLPAAARRRPVDWPRWALVFSAISQFSIVVSQLFLPQPMTAGMTVAPTSHLEHETVAFNFAVGVALLWGAARPGHARTQLPMLLSFTVPLVALSFVDLAGGQVGWYRLASHVPLLIGVLCTALIGGRGSRRPWPGNRASLDRLRHARLAGASAEAVASETASREHRPPAARRDAA
ncbi:zf-HC2 domain-containing protein [Amycolatopsis pigmentata]|uniref:Zf-HC2 domain-containing protein n=1 Tax=Amycolatopsis pigmentata TaxID=450801 RepID=A0ABW5FY45_9PSEU